MRDEQEKPVNEIAAALAKAQGQITYAKKDALNPHFKSRYADLASIWEAIRLPLSINGIAVVQEVTTKETSVTVRTRLVHSSGQEFSSACTFPVAQQTPQAFGSAITYAKRYALAAMVGVAQDDDDANAATEFTPKQDAKQPAKTPQSKAEMVQSLNDSLEFAREVREAVDKAQGVTDLEAIWGQYTNTPSKLAVARPIFAERKAAFVEVAKKNVKKILAEGEAQQ